MTSKVGSRRSERARFTIQAGTSLLDLPVTATIEFRDEGSARE
jgi:hypothetical protein